jgi:hypothetical protein
MEVTMSVSITSQDIDAAITRERGIHRDLPSGAVCDRCKHLADVFHDSELITEDILGNVAIETVTGGMMGGNVLLTLTSMYVAGFTAGAAAQEIAQERLKEVADLNKMMES